MLWLWVFVEFVSSQSRFIDIAELETIRIVDLPVG